MDTHRKLDGGKASTAKALRGRPGELSAVPCCVRGPKSSDWSWGDSGDAGSRIRSRRGPVAESLLDDELHFSPGQRNPPLLTVAECHLYPAPHDVTNLSEPEARVVHPNAAPEL